MSGSWRQNLNTGSYTEAELIGIDDALKHIMWGLYFIQAHGYEVTKNILMQDNKSTILMARMADSHAPSALSISRTDTSRLRIKLEKERLSFNTAQLVTCGQISTPMIYKEVYSTR